MRCADHGARCRGRCSLRTHRVLVQHLWPANQMQLKVRVMVALGLLVGAKLLNIQVHLRCPAKQQGFPPCPIQGSQEALVVQADPLLLQGHC